MKVLYVLSQKPGNTGSGVYLNHITKEALKHNIDLRVVTGISDNDTSDSISHIDNSKIFPVVFGKDTPFPIAGMSDIMPYSSIRFSDFNDEMFNIYCRAFENIFKKATLNWTPDIIHSNHLWIVTAILKKYFKDIPVIVSCHGTALRQKVLSPHIEKQIVKYLKQVDTILVLTEKQKKLVKDWLGLNDEKIVVTGSGYASDIFSLKKIKKNSEDKFFKMVYAGKISYSKGVPYLIEAFLQIPEKLRNRIKLYIAGDYNNSEGERIRNRIISSKKENIIFLGKLSQTKLAEKMEESHLFILPSLFEGLPLVVIEALACGCAVLVTELPDISEWIDNVLIENNVVKLIPPPKLKTVDMPVEEDIDAFIENIKAGIIFYAEKYFKGEFPEIEKFMEYITCYSFENLFDRIFQIYTKKISEKRKGML